MRILHTVEFYEPRKGGAETVVKELSERLVKAGHEVTVATTADSRRPLLINGVRIEQFAISGNAALGIKGESSEIRRYQELLGQNFDVILNYAAQNWTTDLALEASYRVTAKRILVPCGYSGLRNPQYANYFHTLPDKLQEYDALIYMSNTYQDKIYGDENGLGAKAVYIPNGASAEEFLSEDIYNFRKKHGVTTPFMALCVANHYIAKGHDFVIEAFRKMNRSDATLVIIGESRVSSGMKAKVHFVADYLRCRLAALLNTKILLVRGSDISRAGLVSAYKQADVFMFGSRLECSPLVMYESFASKTPFVTRPVGNTRDHAAILKLAETPQAMAQATNAILDDAKTASDIAERAFTAWKADHTWDKIAAEYEKLYQSLVS